MDGAAAGLLNLVSDAKDYEIHLTDAFAWLEAREPCSVHAIVTDPPYGLKEYSEVEKIKLRMLLLLSDVEGVWRPYGQLSSV